MKYIRTKNGIIDMNKYNIVCGTENKYERVKYVLKSKKHRKNGQDYTVLLKEAFIKEADTIEELCDEIVIDCKENLSKKPFIHILSPKYYMKRNIDYKDLTVNVYGAIWTNKGLIYVAKMNKEGELELI